MLKDSPNGTQRIFPMLAYEDAAAAIDWLVRAFGFREVMRMAGEDGRIAHAELELESGVVYLASPTPDYQGPRRHREACGPARKWSAVPWVIDGVMVEVDDADAHHSRAKAAGATILSAPEVAPYGRAYRAEDLEGHRWMFTQPNTEYQEAKAPKEGESTWQSSPNPRAITQSRPISSSPAPPNSSTS